MSAGGQKKGSTKHVVAMADADRFAVRHLINHKLLDRHVTANQATKLIFAPTGKKNAACSKKQAALA